VLGTVAAYILVKFGRFPGQALFSSMIVAPLVMPEVITGLSLLLLFVGLNDVLGWPSSRGAVTIWIAHVTFSVAFVTILISSRLREMDGSLEEAAMDLGAPPLKVFFVITLPLIMPALISGWLLAFTLSLDDLVIASFVSGPGSSTLPMVIYSSVRLGVSPKINALATLFVALILAGSFLAWWSMQRWSAYSTLRQNRDG
jgi:putrescine transport system permease protein